MGFTDWTHSLRRMTKGLHCFWVEEPVTPLDETFFVYSQYVLACDEWNVEYYSRRWEISMSGEADGFLRDFESGAC